MRALFIVLSLAFLGVAAFGLLLSWTTLIGPGDSTPPLGLGLLVTGAGSLAAPSCWWLSTRFRAARG